MTTPIGPNDTIADVVSTLHDPEWYLLGVRAKMGQCKNAHADAVVRIGIRGKGEYPCYRVTYNGPDGERLFGAFTDNHKRFPSKDESKQDWSRGSMNYQQLEALISAFHAAKAT